MAKDNERVIGFYDLYITAKTDENAWAEPISVFEAFDLINGLAKEQRKVQRDGAKQYHSIADWAHTSTEAALLVLRSDKEAADPVFQNHATGTLRSSGKTEIEGGASSAHIVVRHDANSRKPSLMLLEMRKSLGTTRVCQLLTTILRKTRQAHPAWFNRPDPSGARDANGDPVTVKVNFTFHADAHISESARAEIESGQLTGIELIESQEHQTEWDSSGIIIEKKKTVLLGLKKTPRPKAGQKPEPLKPTMSHIMGILGTKQEIYPTAKIRFKPAPGAPETTISWSAESGLDSKYVKKVLLTGFSPKLVAAYDLFHAPLLNKIKGLANASSAPTSRPILLPLNQT